MIYGVSVNKLKGIGHTKDEQQLNVHGLRVPKHVVYVVKLGINYLYK